MFMFYFGFGGNMLDFRSIYFMLSFRGGGGFMYMGFGGL